MISTIDYYWTSKKGEEFNVRATQTYETVDGEINWYSYGWVILWGTHVVQVGTSSGGSREVKEQDLKDIIQRCRFQIKSFEDELEKP